MAAEILGSSKAIFFEIKQQIDHLKDTKLIITRCIGNVQAKINHRDRKLLSQGKEEPDFEAHEDYAHY